MRTEGGWQVGGSSRLFHVTGEGLARQGEGHPNMSSHSRLINPDK